MDHETYLREVWKALGWRLFTTCRDCREMRHCSGKRRDSMRCLGCYDLTDEAENVLGQRAATA